MDTDKVILVASRHARLTQEAVQEALDYIAIDINRLRAMGPFDATQIQNEYQRVVGAINLLNHLTRYCDTIADARAEAEIARRKALSENERRSRKEDK